MALPSAIITPTTVRSVGVASPVEVIAEIYLIAVTVVAAIPIM